MTLNVIDKLENIYSRIPAFDCKHCSECSGPILWFEPEEIFIRKYLGDNNIKRVVWTKEEFEKNDMKCPYLKDHRCSIYPVRPLVCRLQGVVPDLLCKKNKKQKNISKQELDIILEEFKKLILDIDGKDIFYSTKKL